MSDNAAQVIFAAVLILGPLAFITIMVWITERKPKVVVHVHRQNAKHVPSDPDCDCIECWRVDTEDVTD